MIFIFIHLDGAPGKIRTSDPQIRSLMLCSAAAWHGTLRRTAGVWPPNMRRRVRAYARLPRPPGVEELRQRGVGESPMPKSRLASKQLRKGHLEAALSVRLV